MDQIFEDRILTLENMSNILGLTINFINIIILWHNNIDIYFCTS